MHKEGLLGGEAQGPGRLLGFGCCLRPRSPSGSRLWLLHPFHGTWRAMCLGKHDPVLPHFWVEAYRWLLIVPDSPVPVPFHQPLPLPEPGFPAHHISVRPARPSRLTRACPLPLALVLSAPSAWKALPLPFHPVNENLLITQAHL